MGLIRQLDALAAIRERSIDELHAAFQRMVGGILGSLCGLAAAALVG